jgi:putative chitinase
MSFEFDFTLEKLKQCVKTNTHTEELYEILNDLLPRYEITTVNRVAGFLAQCSHESRDFTVLEENLNYSAQGLLGIFKKYFVSADIADEYARKPEKIANRVYANRMGNGDEASGDGWKYRGRGAIQLTGRNNYKLFAMCIGKSIEETVEYCKTKKGAIESSCWFWQANGINKACDAGDIKKMTQIINGGTIGLEERTKNYQHALEIFGA